MTAVQTRPTLRLVTTDAALADRVSSSGNARPDYRAVAPPRIPANDARWALAVRAATLVEGGRAGLLTPENRRRVLEAARLLGLRDFDANLIIAIVQDAARAGLDTLGADVQDRLRLVAPAGTGARQRENRFTALAIACTLGMVVAYVLCKWVTAG